MDIALIAVVVLLLPLAVARPFAGAVVYTTLAYLRPQNLVGGIATDVRLSLFVLAATCLGTALAWARGKERPLLRTPWFVLLFALAAICGLATRTAVFPALARDAWLDFLKLLTGVAVTVSLATTPERVRILTVTAALSLGAMTAVSLAWPVWDAGRLTGGGGDFRDSNDFALALCMALPLLLCLWRTAARPGVRAILVGLVPVLMVAIILTHSRGGFLALAAMLAAWALTTRGRIFKLALAPAAIVAFLGFAPASFLDRMTTIEDYSHDSSARDRLSAWRVAARIAEERPFTGVGPGNFLAVYRRYSNDFRSPHVAHNTPLQLLADAGVFATAAFLALQLHGLAASAGLARRARLRRRSTAPVGADRRTLDGMEAHGNAVALALLAFLVGSQFLSRDDMDLFYLLTGLSAAMAHHARRRLPRRSPPAFAENRVEVPCVSAA